MSTSPAGTTSSSSAAWPSRPCGFVEAVSSHRVLGWAWDSSRPSDRLRVELRLGETVLAEGIADMAREDLATSGIGDGCHAFSLAVDPAHRNHAAEFVVVAYGVDGPVTLTSNTGTPAAGTAERMAHIERGLNALVGSQRLIHRNLQAVLMAVRSGGTSEVPADAAGDSTREELRQQIATLEIFVSRLDERLAALAEPRPAPERGGSHAIVLALLGGVAGLGFAAAAFSLY